MMVHVCTVGDDDFRSHAGCTHILYNSHDKGGLFCMTNVRVAIIGSTGYGGVELVRLLSQHPYLHLSALCSSSLAGQSFIAEYPHLQETLPDDVHTLEQIDVQQLCKKVDVVFISAPAGVSAKIAPLLLAEGVRVIDLAGDFRLKQADVYAQWYRHQPPAPSLLSQAVYGLSEVYASAISHASLVANPGCYPTAATLGLVPALLAQAIDPATIIIDAKSGVSGAGRALQQHVHFSEINENVKAYKVNTHQHIPEIEQVLSEQYGATVTVTFTTHLMPMTRGLMCTTVASVKEAQWCDVDRWIAQYKQYYSDHPFVRIRPAGTWPATKEVYGSNYCDIGFSVDPRTNRVTIISVIDNLVKGAAGQAIQNANVMYGFPAHTGLLGIPLYP